MAIGDTFLSPVEKILPGGEGLALHGGKKVFIPLSAPGDLVRGRITEDHGSWARAEIAGLEEASPLRVEPRCSLYGRCGGCSLQHLSYEAQLQAKGEILSGILSRTGAAQTLPPLVTVPSKPWEYRNRLSLHAIRANRGPRCGFKARKSHAPVPVEDCPIADPVLRPLLKDLRPPPGKDRFTLYGRGTVLLAEEGTGIPGPVPSRGAVSVLDRKILLDASCFFQSNAGALEALIPPLAGIAEKAAAPADPSGGSRHREDPPAMADLYAGVGTFTVFLENLFPGGADLLEENRRALRLAEENLGRREGFRYVPRRDTAWVPGKSGSGGRIRSGLRDRSYSFAVADPPRQGLSPSVVRWLCRQGPPVLAYVSCDPASLSRDYRILCGAYKPEELYFFDFYPQTAHIESLVVFVRSGGV
ncbi:MAG: class I SAM-dependent RNA methyltransferase [Spirochaetaceae bacterium]|jgi:23S rRNA (uracil1939-C5)-methyltransferase|nr:class I SAM-dependent RNA methyltransferase [Spirochaetaceae bacterium]